MTKKVVTNDGKKGGWLVGKRHYDKGGKPLGGIKAVVTDAGGKPVELEGGEVIINREASKKHWKELSRINQSAGNGVPIEPPSGSFDEDPSEDYENGGKIEFNANHIPNKWILNYAIKIKEEHPDVWDLGGNIFGNQAFINLKRVAERGHWLDSEEWMYKKWRSFVARHKGDFRIQGVIAMLKWVDKVDKGWQYMKNLIEEEIKKSEAKKSRKMSDGGRTPAPLKDRIKGSKFNEKGTASTSSKAESIKFDDNTIASIQSLIDAHNDKYQSKKITLAVAKAVVRRGMGAYSSSHRTTITGGKPNSRTAWGLARLKAFIHKAQTGKSKSGKYSQDNDLFEELNISVQKLFDGGGNMTEKFKHSKEFAGITIYTNDEQEYVGENFSPFDSKGSFKATVRKGDLENIAIESNELKSFNFQWGLDDWKSIAKKLKNKGINKLELYSIGKIIKTYELRPLNKMENGGLIAPNGKESNLTPEQYKLVRTPEFKKWFGDWENDPENASKVVDENGEPLVAYHGTDERFNIFSYSKINDSSNFYDILGFYFTLLKPKGKSGYGKYVKSCFLNIKKQILVPNKMVEINSSWQTKPLSKAEILLLIKDKKPLYNEKNKKEIIEILVNINEINKQLLYIYKKFFNKWEVKNGIELFQKNLTDKLGFDGSYMPHSEYIVAFHPNQIKLADGTNTTFDANNADIRFDAGGDVRGMSWYTDFKKQQLKKGTEHELEHSDTIEKFKKEGVSDRQVAAQIAKDHLEEDENYYIELDKMERKKFATGGLVTTYGGEANIGDKGQLNTRKGRIDIEITNITDKWVIFNDLTEGGKRKDTPRDKFIENYRGNAPLGSSVQSQQVASTTKGLTLADLSYIKILVDTPEKSENFQKLIFSLGGEWDSMDVNDISKRKEINHVNNPYLVTNPNGKIYFLTEDDWKNSEKGELSYDDIFGSTSNQQKPTTKSTQTTAKQWTADDFKNTKIIVDTPEKSKKFQELIFSLGGEWSNLDVPKTSLRKKVHFTGEKYLCVGSDLVFFTFSKKSWDDSSKREIFYDDIFGATPQTQPTAHKLANYRIKTKQELENEFGASWRFKVGWVGDTSNDMDWLFGKPITEIVDKADYDSVLDKVVNNKRFDCSKYLDPRSIAWTIYSEAYKFDSQLLKANVDEKLGEEIDKIISKAKEAASTTPQVSEKDVKSEKDLLVEQYNDVLFLISVTPTTDTENMLSLKAKARELKDAIDLIDLELRKKAQTELTLLDELFDASTIKPQERYKFMPYSDGFAPDGQPTALPKNVYNWTMSEEFQNWFGNFTLAYNYRNSSYENVPCSVVVNKNYEPLIVYHGTGSEFSFFKFDSFPAMYFAENEAYSNWFAEMKGQQNGTQGYVYPFVLNIRTPLDLTLFETNKISAAEFIDWMYLQTGLDENELKVNKALLDPSLKNQAWVYLRNSPEMLKVLRDKNVCDGIIYYEDNPSVDVSSPAYMTKAYIVFNANSAKIANNERHIQTIPAMRSFYLKRGGKL